MTDPSTTRWRITLPDGKTWAEDDLLVGEMAVVERLQQARRLEDIAGPLASFGALISFVVAHLHKVDGMTLPEAFDVADAIPVAYMTEIITEYEGGAPLAGAATSTN